MVSNHRQHSPGISNARVFGIDLLAEHDLRELQETIAQRLLKIIVPWVAAVSLLVLVVELVSESHLVRIVPAAILASLFGLLAFFPRCGSPLARTSVIIVTVYLSMAYLGWAVQSFRAPAVVGLAMLLITWTCLFTSRTAAIGVLAVLLVSNGAIFALMRWGVYVEQPPAHPQLSLIILSGIYGALFISVLAPIRILYESVSASRHSETTATEALAELRKSRNFTIQAVDHSLHLFGWLSPDGRLHFANATSLAMIHAKLDDVIGTPFWDTPWFRDAPTEQERAKEAIFRASLGETVRYETTHRNWDGTIREIELSIHPILEDDGNVSVLVTEGRDATDEHFALRQKDLLSERLHQSQKLEMIGQLTGGVAHDFNNSLSSIGGLAQLLKEDDLAEPQRRGEYLDMILEATANATALTRRLLAFSRKEVHKLDTPVDMRKLLENVATMLRRTQDKRVTISVDCEIEGAIVLGDESMLQNAFLNMGINAFHAMPDGGKLELGLGARRLEATDCDQLKPPVFPGDYFDVSIRDTGCGMSAEVAKRIFEPFFTTKESGKGTGLGMSMVHDTLKELGGSISVDSRLGEGTTFHVYLPRTASPPS